MRVDDPAQEIPDQHSMRRARGGYASGVAPDMFVLAASVAARAFQHHRRDQTRELYLTHALDVAQALGPDATVSELSTAVLHDVLEDTGWTMDDLAESGVEATVLDAVGTLTRRPEEQDEEFVARICATPGDVGVIAQRVKLADLTVNIATADSDDGRERFERSLPIVRATVDRNR
jgi:(p)ppGpp synthase/HD superfamily hydrolase